MSRLLLQRACSSSFRIGHVGIIPSGGYLGLSGAFHSTADVYGAAAAQKAKPEQPKAKPEQPKIPSKAADAKPVDAKAEVKAEAKEARVPSEKVMKLVNELADLSVLEFGDLTEHLKKKLGLDNLPLNVPMMMPAGMMMPGMAAGAGAGAAAAPAAEEKPPEKTAFDIKLEKYEAADKIKVIKEVRSFTALGLKEAKDLVEKLPAIVKKSVTKEEATELLAKLKAAGATAVME